jgi:hypothetical protein
MIVISAPAARAASATPSAVGVAMVSAIVVSPAYQQTGTVVAVAAEQGCHSDCVHLWATHDGGHSWAKARGQGWSGQVPAIAAQADGSELMVASGNSGVVTSADGGNTWKVVGPVGSPSFSPSFREDRTLAVASAPDYQLKGGSQQAVQGSGGRLLDIAFAFAPSYPASGSRPPALLSAADKKTNAAVVARCDAQLTCNDVAVLPGAVPMYSVPAALLMSSDYANDGVVFAQTGRGLFKSTNAGGAFTPLNVGGASSNTATPAMALAPGYRESGPVRTAYAAVFQVHTDPSNPYTSGGVYRSTDGGSTWSQEAGPKYLTQGSSALAVAPDGRIFAGYFGSAGGEGLVCSTDHRNWSASCPATVTHGVAAAGSGSSVAAPNAAQGAGAGSAAGSAADTTGGNQTAANDTGSGSSASGAAQVRRSGNPAAASVASRLSLAPWAVGLVLIASATGLLIARRRSQRGRPAAEGVGGNSEK